MRRNRKKSETLDIRLPYEQKRDFMEATQTRGETASEVLRGFIANYIETARLAETPTPVQEITMTLARHRLKTLATAASAALGAFALTALPSAADSSPFDRLDKNSDGVISEGEIIPGEDADIIAHLDTDKSGNVSRAELEAAGDRIVVEQTEDQMDEDGKAVVRKTKKVVEFKESDGDNVTEKRVQKRVVVKKEGGGPLTEEELDALVDRAVGEGSSLENIEIEIDQTVGE